MNSDWLKHHHLITDPWSPFAEHYQDVIARAAAVIAAYPPVLRQAAQCYWDQLLQAPFTRIAVLLPAWIGEMLGSPQPLSAALGLANLWGWAYYRLQDWLVDNEAEHDHVILFGIAFFAEYLRILCEQLPHDPSFSDRSSLSGFRCCSCISRTQLLHRHPGSTCMMMSKKKPSMCGYMRHSSRICART